MFKNQRNISKVDKAEMLKRYEQGETVEQIAEKMKRTKWTIHRHLREMGVLPESVSKKLKIEKQQDKEAMMAVRKRNTLAGYAGTGAKCHYESDYGAGGT